MLTSMFNKVTFSPVDSGEASAPIQSGELSVSEITDLLAEGSDKADENLSKKTKSNTKDEIAVENEDEVVLPDEETEESTEEDDSEEETEDEEKIDLDEDDDTEKADDELELIAPVKRKEILAKYPNVFKDFPYLEHAYYRNHQFSELFATPSDAKEAVAKAQTLDNFERELMSGDTKKLLGAIKEENVESFHKVVDNYLETLKEVDERAFHHVVGNISKNIIYGMVVEANRSGNDALKSAAALLNQYMFGKSEFTAPVKLAKQSDDKIDPRVSELEKREQAFAQQQYQTAYNQLETKVTNIIKSTIDSNIDPKNLMSDYVKKHASKEAMDTVIAQIRDDKQFGTILQKLWADAHKNDYSAQSLDKIKSAIVSRARTLLPTVIKAARNTGYRGMGKKIVKDGPDKKGPVAPGRSATSSSGRSNSPKPIPAGMTTRDYFMQD